MQASRMPHSSQVYLLQNLWRRVFPGLARSAHRCGSLRPAQFQTMVQLALLERIVPERIVPERLPQLALNSDRPAMRLPEHGCNVVRQAHSVEAQRVAMQKALEPQALKNLAPEHIFVVVPDMPVPDPATRMAAQNLGGQRTGAVHSGAVPHIVGQSVVALVCMPVRGSANPVVLVVALALSRAAAPSQAL